MAFKKGQSGNPNGKPKGATGKVSGRAKELLLLAIDQQSDKFNLVMNTLSEEEPKEWAKIMVNLFKYVAPEKIDLTTNDKDLTIPVTCWADDGKKSKV